MEHLKFIKESASWKNSNDTLIALNKFFIKTSSFQERINQDLLLFQNDSKITKIMNEFDIFASEQIFNLRNKVTLMNERDVLRVLDFYRGTINGFNFGDNIFNYRYYFDLSIEKLSKN